MEPTVSAIFSKYLDWCAKHRSIRTTEWYDEHLASFLAHLGDQADRPLASLKPYHVVEWVDSHENWGDTYKRGGIVAVQRACNWAEQMGYIDATPLKRIAKPPARRRDNPMAPEDFQTILARIGEGDPFRDLFLFLWHTGCRPQEARHIEPRHIDLDRAVVVIPKEEAKGKALPAFYPLAWAGPGDRSALDGEPGGREAIPQHARGPLDEVRSVQSDVPALSSSRGQENRV